MAYETESALSSGRSNDTVLTANSLSSGVAIKGALSSSSDVDYYQFNVSSAGLIRLDFSNTLVSSSETWSLALLDSNGDFLTQLTTTALGAPAVYGTTNTGKTLQVSGLTTSVPLGSRFTLATSSADTTIYTVVDATPVSGGLSTLTLDRALPATSPTSATALVFDPLQVNATGGSTSVVGTVPVAGNYYVKLSAANWNDADYQLKASFLPTLETVLDNGTKYEAVTAGNRFIANAWMTGTLASQTDNDVWLVTTAAASDFSIDFAAATGDDNSPEWSVKLETWSGAPLTTVRGTGLSDNAGKSKTFDIPAAKYNTANTYVVTVAVKDGVTFDPGSYSIRVRGATLDLNDRPVITVDTVSTGSGNSNIKIDSGVIRSLKASTVDVVSKVALNSLFSVSDADTSSGQTVASYRVSLVSATDSSATGSIKIINGGTETAYANGDVMTQAQMANAYVVAGTTLGSLTLSMQAFDSSNAPDDSGTSQFMTQTIRLVSQSTGLTVTNDGALTLVEGAVSGESGFRETLSFVLTNEPTSDVLVYLEQTSPNQLTLSKSLLTFKAATGTTSSDYSTVQTVDVSAMADGLTEGSHTGSLKFRLVSADTAYDGLAVAAQSFAISDPVNHPPAPGSMTLAGVARVGQALSAVTTNVTDAEGLGTFNYQWQRQNGDTWDNIGNANTSAYLLTADDLGKKVRANISYLDQQGNPETLDSTLSNTVGPAGLELSGAASFWKNRATKLKDVSVATAGQTGVSDTAGAFALTGLAQDSGLSTFALTASKAVASTATASTTGISLTDVLAALKVYLSKPLPTEYNSDFKYIAADFNNSGDVTLSDVLLMLKYYLNKDTGGIKPTWAFVDAADVNATTGAITGLTKTVDKSYTTLQPIDQDLATNSSIELIGILRGDVDGSWTGN